MTVNHNQSNLLSRSIQSISFAAVARWKRLAMVVVLNALLVPSFTFADEAQLASATGRLLQQTHGAEWDKAIATARTIAANESASIRSIAALVQLARRLDATENQVDHSADVHDMAAYAVMRLRDNDPEALTADQAANLLLSAANGLTRFGRHMDAHRWLDEVHQLKVTSPEWTATCMSVAAGLLDEGHLEQAQSTYQMVIESGDSPQLATARLGLAWCTAMSGEDDQTALEAIDQFLQHHSDHTDVPSALLMKMSCQFRTGQSDAADQTLQQLLAQHADSGACLQAIMSHCNNHPLEPCDGPLAEHLLEHAEQLAQSPSFTATLKPAAIGLLVAVTHKNADAEQAFADAIATRDELGDTTAAILEHLTRDGLDAEAQRIATRWISPVADTNAGPETEPTITAGVRESACRWAGRTSNWSILALAAKDEEPFLDGNEETAKIRGRNLHVERLFAEALLQTGDAKSSLKWWQRIVDEGGADDFPTLLRLAETAASSGTITEAAQRIASARAAISPTSPQSALVNLLAADVEIRQLNFDRGRSLLESVVRLGSADEDARGRAQWMIGETFYMQERFGEAIDAYRLVEGISGDGQWTAAALVQAGKSFEQLGRTREAAVCYSTLVRRFANSQHATGARRRLAALSPDASSESPLRR
ncbi:MAG: tol-pal system YbgF family protein [Rhodopirellula sp. JB055]|uniref:tol-pal system YbgF family protein n=1 Tax=Rhodopirellula sp. JB055 TaxID=3342846 RepID=UPI00370A8F23